MKEDEIDLIQLYNKIKTTKPYKMGVSLVSLIRKNAVFLSVFVVLGIGFRLFLTLEFSKYKSSFVVKSSQFENATCEKLIVTLQDLILTNDQKAMQRLGLDVNLMGKIADIEFIYTDDKDRKDDKKRPFEIEIITYSDTLFVPIQNTILDYLNNSEYAQFLIQENKIFIEDKKREMLSELVLIDSIQNLLVEDLKERKLSEYPTNSPDFLLNQQMKIKLDIAALDKELRENTCFVIIKHLTPISKPLPPRPVRLTFYGIMGFLMGLFLLVLIKRPFKSVV